MRIALVTGASRGIGVEVARQLAARGLTVLLSARSLDRAADAARTIGGAVHPIALDVDDPASIAAAGRQVRETYGRVDVIVNNAAILLHETSDVLDIPAADFRRTLDTNVLGAIGVCQQFVPGMVDRRYGRVVNVSSRAGQLSTMSDYAPAYSLSKAALNAFTRLLATSVNGTGVLVNSACPGWVRTAMGGRHAPRSPAEGADTIVWLATLPDDGPTGEFFSDRRRLEW
jgi:NAD(P)-dependent dehydrogenase (short-subunit alcohol dehydrogenase family)